jgi:hypothetical protein
MLGRVDLRIGNRYLAVLPGEGEVEVMLLSPTTGTSFPEGGGELFTLPCGGCEPKTGARSRSKSRA